MADVAATTEATDFDTLLGELAPVKEDWFTRHPLTDQPVAVVPETYAASLEQRIEALVEVLAFYADRASYQPLVYNDITFSEAIWLDAGDRAAKSIGSNGRN